MYKNVLLLENPNIINPIKVPATIQAIKSISRVAYTTSNCISDMKC
jgi:hypothetical protein